LEEVVEADVILHVRDVAHEDTEAQARDVGDILRPLGIDSADTGRLIEVWNKVDLLHPAQRQQLANVVGRKPHDQQPVLISALTGEGLDTLAQAIEQRLASNRVTLDVALDPADGAGVSWLHRHAEVLDRSLLDNGRIGMTVRVDPHKADLVRRKFGHDVSVAGHPAGATS
jgi:GTP-binding protein HflX